VKRIPAEQDGGARRLQWDQSPPDTTASIICGPACLSRLSRLRPHIFGDNFTLDFGFLDGNARRRHSGNPSALFGGRKVYGKHIIIMGGGMQVGQVALGAITEADRHNIRGEHISVDTIPLVGEKPLAGAAARLPRVKAIALAGSLMGGEIEHAVREVRAKGLLVVSLNMAGSVPDAADLVVTDPVQAGVMTVMAVADTAKFTVERLNASRVLT
jgi:hypothetical protein